MEGADGTQLQLAVPIEIHKHRVGGRHAQDLLDGPGLTDGSRGSKHKHALLAAHNGGIVAVNLDLAVAVVLQHTDLDGGQLQLIGLVVGGQILRQDGPVAGAGHTPVVLILVAGFQAADDQVVDAVPVEDAKAVDKGGIAQCADAPALGLLLGDDDLGLLGVIGGIELVGSQEHILGAGNGGHGHNTAGLGPYGIQHLPILIKEVAGVMLLRRHQEGGLALVGQAAHGVALVEV